MKPINKTILKHMNHDRNSGMTYKQLSIKYGLSQQTIISKLKQYRDELIISKSLPIPPETNEEPRKPMIPIWAIFVITGAIIVMLGVIFYAVIDTMDRMHDFAMYVD